jgi:Cu(I)/Ag(I) efflux system membrane fusion protein
MKLEPVPTKSPSGDGGLLAVPASAVLDSGTRRIVYVERSRGLFEPREVVLGPRAGRVFPVLQGLSEGEHVVTRGGFFIDSQFQITGHPSLFYPGGLMAGSAGHQHGAGPLPEPPSSSAQPSAPGQHKH